MTLPRPYFEHRLQNGWNDFLASARDAGLDHVIELAETPLNRDRLSAIFGNSPYLTRSMINNPDFVGALLEQGPDAVTAQITEDLARQVPALTDVNAVMAALRRAKTRFALAVAAADIWELWSLQEVTGHLSDFAELTLDLAVAHLLRAGMTKGELAPPEGVTDPASVPAKPDLGRQSGFVVLGMGKLGARELNYSSDVDLILLFDNEVVRYTGRRSPQQFFVRLARDLVKVMQERTGDGYVFRTDLRLRPDPGATPLALSVDAAEIYYQSVGLNWERAAMIKARPVAGDLDAGRGFLERIRGFVWRKHLDFAAIDDIHAIKKQIHSHHRHGDIMVAGHDVKLGRGGIREIEFFAQIHQLIAGGREYELRVPQTLAALDALKALNRISSRDHTDLSEAYRFLRRVEHRLQMINDEQTHQIPETDEGVAHLATFLGHPSPEAFGEALLSHLARVKALYDGLLERPGVDRHDAADHAITLPADVTSPEMLKTLEDLGYGDTERIAALVEGWHFGRYRALRTPRSRDLLSRILPRLLAAFAETADPDLALTRFDDFLGKLPSGVQILSLFQANPWLLDVLAEILGKAPALAEQLARRPLLLDAVLSPEFFEPLEPSEQLRAELEQAVSRASDYQDVLDITRIWVNERKFRVGVQLLRATVDAQEAGQAFSNIADTLLAVLTHPRHPELL
ncbi:MAG: bifunctional [glutamine synthetase] adenylyltransferase/[glutamine synthetase]-adenylyl-L-tyrosine phosphorylase, partial [Alphaproteobacteria bacterium]